MGGLVHAIGGDQEGAKGWITKGDWTGADPSKSWTEKDAYRAFLNARYAGESKNPGEMADADVLKIVGGAGIGGKEIDAMDPGMRDWTMGLLNRYGKLKKQQDDLTAAENPTAPPPPDDANAYFRAMARINTERGLRSK
jgi:hypothetical protein